MCAVVTAEDQPHIRAPLQPGATAALAVIESLQPTDGTGQGLVGAVAAALKLVENRREVRSQIVVLTDLRQTAFDARGKRDLETLRSIRESLGSGLELVIVDLAGPGGDNLAIEESRIRGPAPKVGDDVRIESTLINHGSEPRLAKINLAVGSRKGPGERKVTVEPDTRVIVNQTVRMNRPVQTYVDVRVDEDHFPTDDRFFVPLNVADDRRVLIVNRVRQATGRELEQMGALGGGGEQDDFFTDDVIDGAKILDFVLNPTFILRSKGHGTGVKSTVITPDVLSSQPLGHFDLVILYDVSSLAARSLKDLSTFVQEGRSLLIVASRDTNALKFNSSLAASGSEGGDEWQAVSPAQMGNDKAIDPAVGIDLSDTSHPVLVPFGDRLKGDLSSVRFGRLRDLMSLRPEASVMLRCKGGQPLAVEMPLGRGRVMLFSFGFELERSNLAQTRAFPPLMWRMVDYLTGQLNVRPPDVIPALTPAVLDVSEPQFFAQTALELARLGVPELEDQVFILPVNDEKVVVSPMPAGRYALRKQQTGPAMAGYSRTVFSHPDARESRMEKTDEASLESIFGPDVRLISAMAPVLDIPRGNELWSRIVLLLVGAYFLEAIIGYLLNLRRERQRARESTL